MDMFEPINNRGGAQGSSAHISDAMAELISAMSMCMVSIEILSKEMIKYSLSFDNLEDTRKSRAAARGQDIRVLKVQGMLAALSSALHEQNTNDKQS